jgi:hypothetical protein
MASISISGVQAAAQSSLTQFRLQQARRDVEKADQVARSLQAQALNAQQQAGEAQETARSIAAQAARAQGVVGQARQALAVIETTAQSQSQATSVLSHVTEKPRSAEPATAAQQAASAVINKQGQTTGTLINTTA